MLAASNIPVDERLPQLGTIASERAMAALFGPMFAPGWTLQRCRIREARYYPGAACLLSYHLHLMSPGGDESVWSLHGRAFGDEPIPAAFRTRPPLATPAGRLPSFLPQLGLALWSFPDDPGIFGLGDVWRRGGTLFDRPGTLQCTPWVDRRPGLETVLVSYVPAKRCILRYDRVDHAEPRPFFGKVYATEKAATLYMQMEALWDYARAQAPELLLARPLGYDPHLNALWQGSPGGEALLEVLTVMDRPATMRRVAAALAALHRAPLCPERAWRVEHESEKLERTHAALSRFYPTLRRQIDQTLSKLVDTAPPETAQPVPVHGDFHCNQVLVREDRVALIDFDLFGMGDPLHDVARFLSRFRAFTYGKLSEEGVAEALDSFLGTYEILVPWRVDRRRLYWFMAALLVNRQALKAVKKLSAGGPEPVAEMLSTAARMAEGKDLQ